MYVSKQGEFIISRNIPADPLNPEMNALLSSHSARYSLESSKIVGSRSPRERKIQALTLVLTRYNICINVHIALSHQPTDILQPQSRIHRMCSFGTHIFLFRYFCNCIYVSTWTKPFFQAYVPRRWDTRKNDRCGKTMSWIKNTSTGYYESWRMSSDTYTNTTSISPHGHPLTWFIDFWTRTIWESEGD